MIIFLLALFLFAFTLAGLIHFTRTLRFLLSLSKPSPEAPPEPVEWGLERDSTSPRSGGLEGGLNSSRFYARLAAFLLLTGLLTQLAQAAPSRFQTYYLSIPEDDALQMFHDDGNQSALSPVRSVTSIAIATTGTIIYFDHWEDGYAPDITTGADEIWGDGNLANGCPPNKNNTPNPCLLPADDQLVAGNVVVLANNVNVNGAPGGPYSRDPGEEYYDGRDKLLTSFPVAATRALWPLNVGSLQAGGMEMYDTVLWGDVYLSPYGEGGVSTGLFEDVRLFVLAGPGGSTLSLDLNDDGDTTDPNEFANLALAEGEKLVIDGPQAGSRLTVTGGSDVQVNILYGDTTDTYEMRWSALLPLSDWSNDYYTPVGTGTGAGGCTNVWVYNPGLAAITVNYTFGSGATGTFNVPARSTAVSPQVPAGSGARFYTTDPADIFLPLSVTDCTGVAQLFDWDTPLFPAAKLTPDLLVGWAPGCTDESHLGVCREVDGAPATTTSRSVVWVTPLSDTTIYVDTDGSGIICPSGAGAERTISATALTSYLINDDPTSRNNVRHEFAAANYAANGPNNTQTWTTAWTETGDDGLATGGSILINGGVLQFQNSAGGELGDTIQRSRDLTGQTFARLSFQISSSPGLDPTDDIIVEVTSDGTTWNPLEQFQGPITAQQTKVYNISPYISATTAIRFRFVDELEAGDTWSIDNLNLEYAPDGDFDMTGAYLRTCDGTKLSSAYGQNPAASGSSDNEALDLGTVVVPYFALIDLALDKQITDDTPEIGSTVLFTLTVSNSTGRSTATNIDVTDVVPTGYTYLAGSITGGSSRGDTAPYTTGLTWTIDLLDPGITVTLTYQAIVSNSGVYTNYAEIADADQPDVDSEPGNGSTTEDDDDTQIVTPVPPTPADVTLSKRDSFDPVVAGGVLTYTIVYTNNGPGNAHNVLITDTLPAQVTFGGVITQPVTVTGPTGAGQTRVWTVGTLAAGASGNIVFTVTVSGNTSGVITNSAVITTTSPDTNPFNNNDSEPTTVITPSIALAKTPDGQQVVSGDTVTFTIRVTNTGNITLTNVTVTDPIVPACARNLGVLPPGATTSYTCSLSNTTVDFTNVATVTGTPPVGPPVTDNDDADVDVTGPAIIITKTPDNQQVLSGDTVTFTIQVTNTGDVTLTNVTVTDPLVPDCDTVLAVPLAPGATISYTCSLSNVTADFTNVASVTGTPPTGPNVTDDDDANVDVINPAIIITKSPDNQQVPSGSTVTFTIRVTNTGDVTLTNVTVSDPIVPNCARTLGVLTPSATTSYTCSLSNTTVGFTNVATVTGTPPLGPNVDDDDDANVTIFNPAIVIAKTPDTQQVVAGSAVTFTIQVTNTGDITLTNVTVTDPLVPACNRTLAAPLAPGATTSYTCSLSNVVAGFTNVATVTGTPPVGPPVTDDDDAEVDIIGPAIIITKTPDNQQVLSGDTVTFTIQVTNTGDVTLTNVTVSDPVVPACANTLGVLVPGATVSYTCSLSNVTADFTNVASVTGTPPTGPNVSDNDDANVDVINPAIIITKTPDNQQVAPGSTVTFTIRVTNTGDVILTNVTVSDPLVPSCARTLAAPLAPSATISYTCSLSNVTVGFTNVATVTGTPPLGPNVDDDDDANVTIFFNPRLEFEKSVDLAEVAPNQVVTYTLTVTNTGNVLFSPVRVTDTLPSGFSYVPGSGAPLPNSLTGGQLVWNDVTGGAGLTPGQTLRVTFRATLPVSPSTYLNTAVVAGTHPNGVITDTDTAPVVVSDPSLEVVKTALAPGVVNGLITFTLRLTNTGPSVLDQIPLIDHFTGPVVYVGGTPPANTVDNLNRVLGWNDLTASAPNGFGRNLAPQESFVITTVFSLTTGATTFTMTNVATVNNAIDIFDNPANDDSDAEVITNEPTAIELLYFEAERQGNAVSLNWATAVEIDNFGFRLLRSSSGALADAVELAFIPGQGHGTAGGATYSYTDKTTKADQSYSYWLVDVDFYGLETFHGPVSVTNTNLFLPLILH